MLGLQQFLVHSGTTPNLVLFITLKSPKGKGIINALFTLDHLHIKIVLVRMDGNESNVKVFITQTAINDHPNTPCLQPVNTLVQYVLV